MLFLVITFKPSNRITNNHAIFVSMSATKLKNAPLKEVIFELHWEPSVDNLGVQTDPEFDLAQGKFAERIKSEFPVHKKLIPDGIQFKLFGAPSHQYWKSELNWPVVQHGQCMIAVNEIEAGYEWEKSYKPLLISVIEKIQASYENELKFYRTKLQYIDAWDLEEGKDIDAIDFVSKTLQTQIINNYNLPGKLESFNIQQNFSLTADSILSLNIYNGINNQTSKPSVIWTTTTEKMNRMKHDDVIQWLDEAHNHCSEIFKNMINPDFYASLDK